MKRICVAIVAAALVMSGCGKSEDEFVGTWIGQMKMAEADIDKMRETMDEETVQWYVEQAESMTPTLELSSDGTFNMTQPDDTPGYSDTWKVEGDKLILASSGTSYSWSGEEGDEMPDLSEYDSTPNKKPLSLSIEADGTQLVMSDETGEMSSKMVYTRQ